ncbi:MAG: fused MFS/spermidine synthase [Bacteroidales bacterium]|nr:fused MFS/spermidine synthase [Bacteroidales bacterium]
MRRWFSEVFPVSVTVLVAGWVVMIFELAGSRILGPHLGTSVVVWTSLIGLIMTSLSAGYWMGGKWADRYPKEYLLSYVLLCAALFILFTIRYHDAVIRTVTSRLNDYPASTLVSTMILFAPASFFLGMVLPFAARLRVKYLRDSGARIGSLYALSTIGSIAGTYMAGFWLISTLGFNRVLFLLVFVLVANSLLISVRNLSMIASISGLVCVLLAIWVWTRAEGRQKDYIDLDTRYNRVLIYEMTDQNTGRPIRMLRINDEKSAAVFLDGKEGLVFEVLRYYHLAGYFFPDFSRALMIGGSGYAFPQDYIRQYPDKSIDVVEIDGELTHLARKYFGLTDDPRLRIFHEDGRTYLGNTNTSYDVVFMDAYKSQLTIPYQLTTQEAVEDIYRILSPDGVVMANIISTLDRRTNHFLRAELATYRSIFPQVYLFAVQYPEDKERVQNIMLVALKNPKVPSFHSEDSLLQSYLNHKVSFPVPDDIPSLTDEFAPVDYYTSRMLKAVNSSDTDTSG